MKERRRKGKEEERKRRAVQKEELVLGEEGGALQLAKNWKEAVKKECKVNVIAKRKSDSAKTAKSKQKVKTGTRLSFFCIVINR